MAPSSTSAMRTSKMDRHLVLRHTVDPRAFRHATDGLYAWQLYLRENAIGCTSRSCTDRGGGCDRSNTCPDSRVLLVCVPHSSPSSCSDCNVFKMLNETLLSRQVADIGETGLCGGHLWLNLLYAFLLYTAFLVGVVSSAS